MPRASSVATSLSRYVLEGELTFWVDGEVIVASAGSFVYGPQDIPHTFLVTSDQARFLLVTEPAGFEDSSHGIDIIGPPGIPD